jgi:uncharacterized protein YjiS (DUF1127 family)
MTAQIQTLIVASWSPSGHFRRLFDRIEDVIAAHDARRLHQGVSDRDLRDAGLSREEALGVSNHQPDLPFFMQPGFGADRVRSRARQ